MAKAKGRLTITRPVISMGGWANMPGWISNGLMPWPSEGTTSSLAKGLARETITAKKKTSISMRTALV